MTSEFKPLNLEELFSMDFLNSFDSQVVGISSLNSKDLVWDSITIKEEFSSDCISSSISSDCISSSDSIATPIKSEDLRSRNKWSDERLEWIGLVDPNADGRFPCPKCPKLYTRKSNLKVHYASFHIGLKRFECPGCSRLFARRSYVRQHQRVCPNNNCF